MHIVFFGDQHLASLGGAQVSMRLQKQYLERAGHTVTVVAPKMHTARAVGGDNSFVDLPSIPITVDREYSMSWPGRRTDRFLDRAFASRPRVDLVHVQGDFWGAFIGHRFAHRHGIPVVHTMHNRVDVGMAAVTPLHRQVLPVLNLWRRTAMRGIGPRVPGGDGWAFLRGLAQGASAVTAPSGHFARRLEQHEVFPSVDVVWNGIDDDLLASVRAEHAVETPSEARDTTREGVSHAEGGVSPRRRPRFVWLGRMSPEKRLLPFLHAVVRSQVDAQIEIIGGGGQMRAAERIARGHAGVRFAGRLSYADTLARIAAADAVVQTSIGFETQGMTPFEAAALGTPTVISDPDIAAELRGGLWAVPDASVAALAETLTRAAADIVAGRAPVPVPEVAEEFRQSSRTAAMIEIYERVLAGDGA
ncbi:glycosyltransferase involved in cell wall biosynthesis [Microbacterium ginsengiterrae]|uniref:D-inositol 3-phosphate glycosyltransferase n=1 Tax=Microbacterium ginsengiterrae TaxID=546115 RepID=A0A7W9CBE2_9MICO|nr:glycosyltransferase family 4 protein [Microbacterium ginsengiterrae]MBB5742507.1 glycosyltransferase involved in cell wall biosynthesis [Microbacterium ginsengiterrae]